jgi:hypothetical protein
MEVDSERQGKIDFDQLCLILGLISQAQQGASGLLLHSPPLFCLTRSAQTPAARLPLLRTTGQEPDLVTMDPETTPPPKMEVSTKT